MKKFIITIIITVFWTCSGYGQDLIVTIEGDSIQCLITKTEPEFIHFSYHQNGKIKRTLLPLIQIEYYETDYYEDEGAIIPKLRPLSQYSKVSVGIYGGWSYLISRIPEGLHPSIQSYMKELKWGHHFGADITYFFSENIGLGVVTKLFFTKSELPISLDINGQITSGMLRDDILISYFGPELRTRMTTANNQWIFNFSFSAGYMGYRNKASFIEDFTLTGRTFGLKGTVGADYKFAPNWAIGLNVSSTLGVLNELELNDGQTVSVIKLNQNNAENITHLDFSIGIKWYK